MTVTKHDKIMTYIRNLPDQSQISVRKVARNLSVSEGTAYRAIKTAESEGLVKTISRVGTLRLRNKQQTTLQPHLLQDISDRLSTHIFVGEDKMNVTVDHFLIADMDVKDFHPEGSSQLVMVGNRNAIIEKAIRNHAPVLLTDNLQPKKKWIELAKENDSWLLGSSLDVYTISTLLFTDLQERNVSHHPKTVNDLYLPLSKVYVMHENETMDDYRRLFLNTGYSHFPVIDNNNKVKGIIQAQNWITHPKAKHVKEAMSDYPFQTKKTASLKAVYYMMTWNNIEAVPVLNEEDQLEGIITRKDLMLAMQYDRKDEDNPSYPSDMLGFRIHATTQENQIAYELKGAPSFSNEYGLFSLAELTSITVLVVRRFLEDRNFRESEITSLSFENYRPIEADWQLRFVPIVQLETPYETRLTVEIYHQNDLVTLAIMTSHELELRRNK